MLDLRPFGQLFAEPTRNGLTRPKAVRGAGTKMVNMGELFANPRIQNIEMDRVPLSEDESQRYLLEAGDLLFARQSLVLEGAGKCSIFLGDHEPVTFESHVTRVRLNKEEADPRFYYYWLQSHDGRAAIKSIVEQGAGAAGIRGSDLQTLDVAWCPVKRQTYISDILGTLDDKIELNRRMNETLEAMARAIFKSWFVEFDPVRAKASGESPESICRRLGLTPDVLALFPDSFQDSELGEIPAGWTVGTIADHSDLNAKSWTTKNMPDKLRYVDLANAKSGVVSEVQVFVSADAPSRARRILRAGDTIIGTVRPGNRSYALIGKGPQLTGSTGFAVLTPKRKALREFVYLAATDDENIDTLSHLADGAAYPAVRPDVVTSGVCLIPPNMLVEAFHETSAALIDDQMSNISVNAVLGTLRDTLLPKLLSGELSVEEIEATA